MKKTLTMLLLTFLVLSLVAPAQEKKGNISGTVTDTNAKAIESATVALLSAPDSSIVKMSMAGETGSYRLEGIGEGKYLVSVSAAGHQQGFSEIFEINAANFVIILKAIELGIEPKPIAGITVVAKKPLIEQKMGRTIVNVETF